MIETTQKKKHWTEDIVPCECAKWKTCKYASFLDWKGTRYAVCGYSIAKDDVRGCPISECNKYQPKAS